MKTTIDLNFNANGQSLRVELDDGRGDGRVCFQAVDGDNFCETTNRYFFRHIQSLLRDYQNATSPAYSNLVNE